MSKKSMKALREEAEAVLKAGVANKQQLFAAVPTMIALQDAVHHMNATIKASNEVLRELVEACSAYAQEHPDYIFDKSFLVSPIGVESGDVTIDGCSYHYSRGFDGYGCCDPREQMSQAFLRALPEGWANSSLKIDTTAINKANPTAEDLAANGLQRKIKNTWRLLSCEV